MRDVPELAPTPHVTLRVGADVAPPAPPEPAREPVEASPAVGERPEVPFLPRSSRSRRI
ncbi:hypothetical protein ACSNN7_21140 [Micromonospora sp. URMC 105]|uniref:hypothetical protein n=1 Tax=Micromonospora sp. URMC 105 TaxID=3423413 RepID=UPI003F1AE9FB